MPMFTTVLNLVRSAFGSVESEIEVSPRTPVNTKWAHCSACPGSGDRNPYRNCCSREQNAEAVKDSVNAAVKMSEIVSMCSDNVRLSVQRFCPLV